MPHRYCIVCHHQVNFAQRRGKKLTERLRQTHFPRHSLVTTDGKQLTAVHQTCMRNDIYALNVIPSHCIHVEFKRYSFPARDQMLLLAAL